MVEQRSTLFIGANTRELERAMGRAAQSTKKFTEKSARELRTTGIVITALGAAGLIMAQKFTKAFTSVQTAQAEVGTLMGFNADVAEIYGEEVRRLSIELGAQGGQVEVLSGLYQTLSASMGEGSDATTFLEIAMKAATAGVTDTRTAVDALSSVVNAYGSDALSAQQASDIFFTAIKRGKTTFPELAAAIGLIAPTASQLNVSLAEVAGGIATLTRSGVKTDLAVTSLNATMLAFLKPSKDMAQTIQDIAGVSATTFLKTQGLRKGLEELTKEVGQNEERWAALFPNIRAVRAVLPLTGRLAQDLADDIDAMSDSTGASEQAFNRFRGTVQFRMNQVQNRVEDAMIRIGDSTALAMLGMQAGLAGAIVAFADLNDASGGAVGSLLVFGSSLFTVLGPVIAMIGQMALMKFAFAESRLAMLATAKNMALVAGVGIGLFGVFGFITASTFEQRAAYGLMIGAAAALAAANIILTVTQLTLLGAMTAGIGVGAAVGLTLVGVAALMSEFDDIQQDAAESTAFLTRNESDLFSQLNDTRQGTFDLAVATGDLQGKFNDQAASIQDQLDALGASNLLAGDTETSYADLAAAIGISEEAFIDKAQAIKDQTPGITDSVSDVVLAFGDEAKALDDAALSTEAFTDMMAEAGTSLNTVATENVPAFASAVSDSMTTASDSIGMVANQSMPDFASSFEEFVSIGDGFIGFTREVSETTIPGLTVALGEAALEVSVFGGKLGSAIAPMGDLITGVRKLNEDLNTQDDFLEGLGDGFSKVFGLAGLEMLEYAKAAQEAAAETRKLFAAVLLSEGADTALEGLNQELQSIGGEIDRLNAQMTESQAILQDLPEGPLKAAVREQRVALNDQRIALEAAFGELAKIGGEAGFTGGQIAMGINPELLEKLRDLGIIAFQRGGVVPGVGSTDSVLAALTPGEVVLPKGVAPSSMTNNTFHITINAETEEGGRAAARGFEDVLRRGLHPSF